MDNLLYDRIKELCREHSISISKLESMLEFGNSSIKKWGKTTSPSIDKIIKVAAYFGVSVDYLLGKTDIKSSASDILDDSDIISFQRARQKMTEKDKQKMMQMLRISFDYAFDEEDND